MTTDPDDRDARRIDHWRSDADGTAELIGWDGMLDRRSGGRLVDAWAGASLVRLGPRGYRDLILLRGLTEIALLPFDPGSTTDTGIILDDQSPRRLRAGPEGDVLELYQPAKEYAPTAPKAMCVRWCAARAAVEHARRQRVTDS